MRAYTSLLLGGLLVLSRVPSAGVLAAERPAASPADIPQIIDQAAKYESGGDITPLRKVEALARQAVGNPGLQRALETGLCKLLGTNATFEARRFACQQLAVVGGESSVGPLVRLLKSEENAGIACQALANLPTQTASDALRQSLPSLKGAALTEAVKTLGTRGDTNAVPFLASLARNPDKSTAEAAVAALGKIGGSQATDAISTLQREAGQKAPAGITEALLACADRFATSGQTNKASGLYEQLLGGGMPDHVRRGALGGLLKLDQDGGESRITRVLGGQDSKLKPVAIAAVSALKSKEASAKFAGELARLKPQEQGWMIEALSGRGDEAARNAIRAKLGDNDPSVRLAAIKAVGKLDDSASIPMLVKALTSAGSQGEKQTIEKVLGMIQKGKGKEQALLSQLKGASDQAKSSILGALSKGAGRESVPALLDEAASANPGVAKAAFQALGKAAEPQDLPAMLDKLVGLKATNARPDAEAALAQALSKVRDVASRSTMVRESLGKTADVDARCSLLRLLPSCPDAKALESLRTASTNVDAQVRESAVRSMMEWPDASAWDSISGIARKPEKESYRALAMRALVRIAGEENAKPTDGLIGRYRQLLSDAKNNEEIKMVLGGIGGAAHPDALKLVQPLLQNQAVRAEAEAAIKKITEALQKQPAKKLEDTLDQLKPKFKLQ